MRDAEQLAALCVEARAKLADAGRALHDQVGPQLAGAGILLSLLKRDHPELAISEILAALDTAMECVRTLSQDLNPSPVDRLGLHNALLRLCERLPGDIAVEYKTTVRVPRAAGTILYEAAADALHAAIAAKAQKIRVRVTGSAGVTVRITDDGRAPGRKKALSTTTHLAHAAGAVVTIATRQSTIVSIQYAGRRLTGR